MQTRESGFTAVELLITLFVAAVFLIAGYQLYSFVVQRSSDARNETRISNVAYDYLRQYEARITNPCTSLTPVSNALITVDGLTDVRITVAINCPNSSVNRLSRIQVTAVYNNPRQTFSLSTFKNGDV